MNKSSKYLGVSYNKERDTWRADIRIKGEQINLGFYKTESEAAKVYLKAKKAYKNKV